MNEPLETQEAPEGMAPEMAEPVKKKRVTVADLQKEIDQIREDPIPKLAEWCGELDARLEALEERTAKHSATLLSDVKTRLDVLDKSTPILSDNQATLLKTHIQMQDDLNVIAENVSLMQDAIIALQEIPEHTELEFATPPAQPAGRQPLISDIEKVASVCLTMNDVLMICRALKETAGWEDWEKIAILNIACKAAGVDDAISLRIRAGISTTQA